MRAGRYAIELLETDGFRLDGGAMFGSVPQALWSRYFAPDEQNRIPLVTRVMLARGAGRCILVDTGTGNLWNEKERELFDVSAPETPGVVRALGSLGVAPADVTDVVITHLHFDHAGGITRRGADGSPERTFPGARVFVQRRNWATARDPNERERRSYLRRHWEPIEGQALELVDGDAEIIPGVHVTAGDGHTDGLQVVRIGEGEEARVFCADLIPLSTHVSVPWTMGYDLCPRTIMKEKRALLQQAAAEGWNLVFEHDSQRVTGRVQDASGRFLLGSEGQG